MTQGGLRRPLAIVSAMATKQDITTAAAELSGAEGFEAVTISRLSGDLGVSAADVAVYFPTDEQLQESIVHAGADVFREHVTEPSADAPEGIEKLTAWLLTWVDYAESDAYRGGFVGGAATLPDHIKELTASLAASWIEQLADQARIAVEAGDLPPGTDPAQIAFEVHGLVQEANWTFGVLGDEMAYERASRGILHRLGQATARG